MTTTVREKLYEGMFLVDSAVAAKDWAGVEAHIQEIISKHGGELVYSEKWPDRRLAYEVKGCRKGTYFLTYFRSTGETIDDMRRDVSLSERILRVLFIQEDGLDEEMTGRQNKEIEPPPAELAIGRERNFDTSGRPPRGGRGGPRRESSSEGGDKPAAREKEAPKAESSEASSSS